MNNESTLCRPVNEPASVKEWSYSSHCCLRHKGAGLSGEEVGYSIPQGKVKSNREATLPLVKELSKHDPS